MLLLAICSFALGWYAYTNAQDDPANQYTIGTVNIFPDAVTANGWDNIDQILFQNLDENALYQEFNKMNSAYLDENASNSFGERNTGQTETSSIDEDDDTSTAASSTQVEPGDIDTSTAQDSATSSESNDDVSDDTTTSSASDNQVPDVSSEETPAPEPAEDLEVQTPEVNEGSTVEEVDDEPTSAPDTEETSAADNTETTAVIKPVQGVFNYAFAVVRNLFPFTQSSSVASTSESEEVSEAEVVAPTAPVVSTTTTTKQDEPEDVEEVADEEEILTGTTESATTSDEVSTQATSSSPVAADEAEDTSEVTDAEVESVDESTVDTNQCDDCASYDINLSGFGLPIFDESQMFGGAQLRLSFGAQIKPLRDVVEQFEIHYSINQGADWDNAGVINIDGEVSNSINGGHFLFALPALETKEELDNLEIKLVYQGDPRSLTGIFIESVWLEVFTVTPPSFEELTAASIEDTGFDETQLSGDTLTLPNGEEINFNNTDENSGEALIIKSDKTTYNGLTKIVTYFNVTNTSDESDDFTLNAYLPEGLGEITSLEEWNQNKPKSVVVPEYRPFVYHCEAGWEATTQPESTSLIDLSRFISRPSTTEAVQDDNVEDTTGTTTTSNTAETSSADGASGDETTISEEPAATSQLEQSPSSSTQVAPAADESGTTTVQSVLQSLFPFTQAEGTTSSPVLTSQSTGTDALLPSNIATSSSQITSGAAQYVCRNTNIVRTCDSIEGDNTACKIENFKVAELAQTKYSPAWAAATTTAGEPPKPNLMQRAMNFIGFGPDTKPVPEEFVVSAHTPDTYTIAPNETKYFKMEISFPQFSEGEYWIEAVGKREYGLLDPFWTSQWDYRMPIEIDNTDNDRALDEDQVFLELDSSLTDFWNNVASDGSDVRFVYEIPGNVDGWYGISQPETNWYDRDWGSRIPMTIHSSQVGSTLANFPVYVDLATLGSDFFNDVQSDGDDIRITLADGLTEVPYEIVELDTGSETGELYFKADTISASTDTTFYIYFNNNAASGYASSATYGSENVWNSGYEAVYHLSSYQDSTSNGRDGLAVGTPSQVSGAFDLDGNTDMIQIPSNFGIFDGSNSFTWQVRFTADAVAPDTNFATSPVLLSMADENNTFFTFGDGEPGDTIGFRYEGWTTPVVANGIATGVDYRLTMSYDEPGADMRMYLNGSETDSAAGTISIAAGTFPANYIGGVDSADPNRAFDGRVDEVRILSAPLTAGWVAAEDINRVSPSTFYATSTVENPPELEEIGEWSYRTAVTIPAAQVAGALTDFPVYLNLADLGADFFTNVQTNGGDIRITLADGLTEVPYELVSIDTGAGIGQLHFKAPALSNISDNLFYVYYGNVDAPAHSPSDVFGADNVWPATYEAVYHLEEDASGRGNSGLYQDSTTNNYDADDELVSTGKTGKLGAGQEIRSRTTTPYEYILFPTDTINGKNQFTASFWVNTTQTGNQALLNAGANNDYLLFLQNNNMTLYNGGATASITGFDTPIVGGAWRYVTIARDASNNQWRVFVDGVEDSGSPLATTMSALSLPADCFMIGGEQDGSCLTSGDVTQHFDGLVDEITFRNVVPSSAEIQTEFNNQSDTTTFYATSSAEALRPTTFTELDFWLQHFDSTAEEADIWLQVDSVPANSTSTVYMYYGSGSATSASDEYAPFTYSSPRDLYYVVNDSQTSPIVVYSYIDNNEVSIDGGSSVILDSGETTSFTTYTETSVISANGPITARTSDDSSEPPAPISFATTTHIITTNRNNEDFYVYSPFATANVEVFEGANGTASAGSAVAQGTATSYNVNIGGNDFGIVESDEPVLLYHNNDTDSYVSYPPTRRDLYGIYSNTYNYGAIVDGTSVEIYCSSGVNGTTTGMTRGGEEINDFCANGGGGTGDAVRLTNQTAPIGATQQADGDGNESSRFLPAPEFGTRYILPQDAEYVSIACAPRFGTVDIEIQSSIGAVIDSGTCTPGVAHPGALNLTAGTQYVQGSQVVATNDVPFYIYYEEDSQGDETNTWGAVQAKRFIENEVATTFGAQEVAIDAQYEQLSYRWYDAVDAQTVTTTLAAEDTSLSDTLAINNNEQLRLRMNLRANYATSTLSSEAFRLQYAEAEVCSAATTWADIGKVGSTTAAFSGYNNASATDGSILETLLLSQSGVAGTYEEENLSSFIQTEIPVGEIAEWDWSIIANNISSNSAYCFRMVRASGEEFVTYSGYPQLETAGPPLAPVSLVYFDNEHTADTVPVLEFAANDTTGDEIHYQVQIDDDVDFSSVAIDRNSISHFLNFESLSNSSDKAPFASGARIRFTAPSSLSTDQTYWWRARARDPDGSDSWGDWSTAWSFTTRDTSTTSEWYQTTGDQFSTNTLVGLSTSTGAVAVSGSSGSMKSTAINFDDATVGNAWGEVFWDDTETSGTITYQVEYYNGSSWALIPNTALPGNVAGFGTSPINLLSLSTDTYETIRLSATFTGTNLSIEDWGVRYGQRVDTPNLLTPFDHEKIATTTPTLTFTATDPESDDLIYELSYGTDSTFVSSTTITTGTFASGATGVYQIPSGSALTNGQTYWWRVRAKDPSGGNAFSPWSLGDSFTVDTTVAVSTWFQTTQEQFQAGTLDGVEALATDEVENSSRIGEYGTIALDDQVWTTVNTNRSYNDMVVVASPEYASDGTSDGRTVRVRNKGSDSFQIKVDNSTGGLSSTIDVDYIVMEAGTWQIEEGAGTIQVVAGTAADVTEVKNKPYSDTAGTQIVFATPFSSPPAVLATVSSDNDSSWVGTHVDDGSDSAGEVGVNDMFLSLGRSTETAVHDPEDIDYIAFDVGDGTNDGVSFESFNSPNSVNCCNNGSAVNYQSAFGSVPAVTVVHNNASNGGDGGFAVVDTTTAYTASTIYLEAIEVGPTAGTHANEVVSIVAFEDASGFIVRDDGTGGGDLNGSIRSEAILFTDGAGPKFEQVYWTDSEPGASSVTYQVEYLNGSDEWELIPNSDLPGNSAGTSVSPLDLSDLNVLTYDTIRLVANLSCSGGDCPSLQDWTLEWSEGVVMSGTLRASDLTTNIATGTIAVAVNDTLLGSTGTVTSGIWSINNVTAFAGDTVTVFVDGADEANEAVAVFVYDGTGNMENVALYENHLSLATGEKSTTTNALLGAYDYSVSGDEDIFFDVNINNDLTTCAVGACLNNSLIIGSGNVYQPDTTDSGNVTTHNVINNGTFLPDANIVRVSGSWENNATFTPDASSVIFTATTTNTTIGTWYDADWAYRVPVTIAAANVDSDLTDFPVYVDLSTLPSDFFANVQSDGDDIRITQSDQTSEVPFELVTINTGAETGELHFKAPLLSASSDTTFYIYYDNPAATSYAASATYGRNNVWTNGFEAVYHLEETGNGSANEYVDSTGNGFDAQGGAGASGSTPAPTAGVLGNAQDFDGTNDFIDTGEFASGMNLDGSGAKTVTAWAYTEAFGQGGIWSIGASNNGQDYSLRTNGATDSWRAQFWGTDLDFTYDSDFKWVHFALDHDGTNQTVFADGSEVANSSFALNTTDGFGVFIGKWRDADEFTGWIDEVRFATVSRSDAWYDAEHANQNAPATFYTVGTQTDIPQTATNWTLSDASGTLLFNNLTFGEAVSTATWLPLDALDVNGTLSTQQGTFNRATATIAVAGNLNIGTNSLWSGVATTTFDGTVTRSWTDSSTATQDVGYVVVDGTSKTVTITSDVRASSITIGANDTLNGGGSYDITLTGDFTNNNQFVPLTSRIMIAGDGTNATIKTNGSSLYALRASSTAGSIAFTEGTVVLLDNFEIATGTVTLPTTLLRVGGSFINEGGAFAHNNSLVSFTGSGSESITLLGTEFLNSFYNVRFNGTGNWVFTDTNATTTGSFTINNGTVDLPTGQLTVGREYLTNAPGTFDANGGEVVFITQSTDSITTNGANFYDTRFRESSPIRGGAFDAAWLYRDVIVINSSQVDSNLTDFPVYVDLADFDSNFFSNVNADGGDIRITQSDGVTEVPREIVAIDTGAETGEMYFKASSVSSSTNTTFYVYYGNALASDYAIDATYGAENVWDDDYLAVYHMEELNALDSTSFDKDLTAVGDTPALTSGLFGGAVSITDNGGADYLDLGDDLSELNGLSEMSVSAWVYVNENTNDDVIFARGGSGSAEIIWDNIGGTTNNDTWTFNADNTGSGANRVDAAPDGISVGDTWQHVVGAMESSDRLIYVDGLLRNTNSGGVSTIRTNTGGTQIGYWAGSTGFDYDGLIDEYRISRVARVADWTSAEYRNMSNPTSFYTVSSGSAGSARIFAEAAASVQGDMVIESGDVQFPSTNLSIGGSFDNDGSFSAGSGTVTFTATTSGNTVAAGASDFANLRFDGPTGSWTIVEDATASDSAVLANANVFTVAPGVTLESAGTFSSALQNASTTWTGATLLLSSGSDQTINVKDTVGDDYGTLSVTGNATVKMWNSTAATYDTQDTSAIYSQDHSAADGDLYIFGNYARQSGTEYWSYDTDFDGTSLNGTERQVDVRVASSTIVLIEGATLEILGDSAATTTVDTQTGQFTLIASSSSLTASNFEVSGTDADGLQLLAGSSIDTLTSGLFNVAEDTTGISVDAATVDANPAEQFTGVDFATAGFSAIGGTITTEGAYTVHTFTANDTFSVVSGSADIGVFAVGGGAGGGKPPGNGPGNQSSGGGGGAFAHSTTTVSSGQSFSIAVGAGGAQQVAGGASTFGAGPLVRAAGGSPGIGTAAGSGGTIAASIGDVRFRGGNPNRGGGGGAGTGGNGGDSTGITGGTGRALYGGNGGNAPSGNGSGAAGSAYGGGGGGARQSSNNGGAGAAGVVVVRYLSGFGPSTANVTLVGAPSSFLWFRDGVNNLYGEDYDNDDGNPGAIRWDDSSYSSTISGVVYEDDGVTPMGSPICNGSAQNVRIVVDGGAYTDTTSCSNVDGSYSFTGVSYVGDPSIVVYLDTGGSAYGSVVTKTPTGDITDLNIYENRVITRHEDTAPLTITDMATYDSSDDTDLRFTATIGSPNTLVVAAETELLVASSTTFAPGGNITLQAGGSGNSYDGSLHIDNNGAFVAAGTQTHIVAGNFFNDLGSSFTSGNSNFIFNATAGGKTITTDNPTGTLDFYDLEFNGVGGSWNLNADITVATDMTLTNGTVTGTGDITMLGGTLGGNGVLSLGGGVTTLNTSSTLGGSSAWTFFDLTVGNGSVVGTTVRSDVATTTILNRLTIAAGHTLEANNSVWELAGNGTVFVETGTFNEGTSTFTYTGGTGATVLATPYYDLRFTPTAGTPTYTVGSGGLLVQNDLSLNGGVNTIVDINANDPTVAVAGDVTIGALNTLNASNAAALTLNGSYDNNGAFNGNAGTITFANSSPTTVAAGVSSFANVLLSGPSPITFVENATSTGIFTISATADFTLQTGSSLAVGGELDILTNATDWTGASLHLYGGGSYDVLSKTLTASFGDLSVATGTNVRFWNSDFAAVTTAGTGSVYSQDHSSVDGDLYIYGSYNESARNDYWSYNTDFDGVDLTGGSERAVAVYIADGGEAAWTGGSISVVGATNASTTINNQGTGTYGITIGGNTTTNWRYATVRDIDADGLTFAGTPTVSVFRDLDLLVEIDSATAMTVAGSAITASPARTFTNVTFNSDTGVTGASNVTATGATLSGWRFTAYTGNLAGENFDVDPGGDPGYIIWDDSAAIISISGNVYEADGVTVSSVCDDTTTNIVLSIAGSIAQNASSSCASATGAYTISGVSFSSLDELMIYINGETDKGALVTKDPISSIGDADIYENHVIVRHENTDPLEIADMTVWDSSDDADIPYTALLGSPDTLTLPANTKLIVWGSKEFAPNGNITLSGGGAGAVYDGSFEALAGATFTAGSGTHSIGGDFEFDPTANFAADTSSIVFTTNETGRVITVNADDFNEMTFTGSGDWTFTDTTLSVLDDFTVTSGAVTLPSATSTFAASYINNSTVVATTGTLLFNAASGSETVTFGDDVNAVRFNGGASWVITDTAATTTDSFTVEAGSVTLPSGTLGVAGDFINTGTLSANNGRVVLNNPAGTTTLTLSGSDLSTLVINGGATVTVTDASIAVTRDLEVLAGTLVAPSGTLAIGGSFRAPATFGNNSGTVLFNAGTTGNVVEPGANDFYNAVFANPVGGWTMDSATTTNNFSLTTASSFTLTSGETLRVEGVFTNNVGGGATTWTGTTLQLAGANAYSINTKNDLGDSYETVVIEQNSDIRSWYSTAAAFTIDPQSSLYSQDHAGVDGVLNIYGDFTIGTTTERWSYASDFDGTTLSGAGRRAVSVNLAANASTTVFSSGSLQVVGASGATTTISNQGSGTHSLVVSGGTLNMSYYSLRDLTNTGLVLSGSPTISSLSYGDFETTINAANLITLNRTALDANPSLLIEGTRFAFDAPATTAFNVNLSATSTNSWQFRDEYGVIAGEAYDVDGITNCGSIRWSDSSCLLTEQTEYRWRLDDGGLGVPDSQWFDTNWDKRKRVRVANNDATAYSDLAVLVTVAYDSDIQTDFDDLRFTAADGVIPVSHWVERSSAGVEAEVWVDISSLGASETESFFMYYDNVSASSVSSSTAVFSTVDDFEDGDITEYSGQTSLFTNNAAGAYGGVYDLELTSANKGTRLTHGIARFDQPIAQGQTIRYHQYVDTVAGSSDEACTLFGVQSPVTASQNYGVCLEQFGIDRITLARDVESTDSYGGVVPLATSTVAYSTGWYEVVIDWGADNVIDVALYDSTGSLVTTLSASDSTYSSGGYGFTSWGQNGAWDSFKASPTVTTDPTIFFGAEQLTGGAEFAAPQNTVASGFDVGDVARLRVAVENTGLDITDQEFQLEFAGRGGAPNCAAVPEGNYATVPVAASCGSSAVCMTASANVTNGVATTDLLEVGRNTFTPGAFVEDPSNKTVALDVDQNQYTELEYALNITVNASDESYCFRVTDNGTPYDSYQNIPELGLQFEPVFGAVSFNGGADISLLPGTTTRVYATGTVTDLNGYTDLTAASSTMYDAAVGAACSVDNNSCYIETTASQCSFTNCVGNSCTLSCYADFFYHANPTDETGGDWYAFLEVEDASGGYNFATSPAIDLLTLRALDVTNSINYGAVAPQSDTGAANATTSVQNLGNDAIDVLVAGTDLSDGFSSTIPVVQQKFATSSFTYAGCVTCATLSTTTESFEVDLNKPTSVTPPVVDEIYWGIAVPFGVSSAPHTGQNVFYATDD